MRTVQGSILAIIVLCCGFLLLAGCSGGGRSPLPIGQIAYIYGSDLSSAAEFKQFLDAQGRPTDLISKSFLPSTDLTVYKLIIIGDDTVTGTSLPWGTPPQLSGLKKATIPIIGIQRGGAVLFSEPSLALEVNIASAAPATCTGVYVVDSEYFAGIPGATPGAFIRLSVPLDADALVIDSASFSGVTTRIGLGNDPAQPMHDLIVRQGNKVFWGLGETPMWMTEAGKTLFVNIINKLINP